MKKQHNILVLSSWSFDEPLTKSYLLPNIKIVRETISKDTEIFLQTSERKKLNPTEKKEIKDYLLSQGVQWLSIKSRKFSLLSLITIPFQLITLVLFVKRKKINFLHPFAPSAGAIALTIHFFTGTKIVMDSWEPHADAMVETKTWRRKSLAYFIMQRVEKRLTFKSHILLAASHGMKEYAQKKFGPTSVPVLYRPAWIDFNKFDRTKFDKTFIKKKLGLTGKFVCVCVSKLGGLYLKEDAFRFFKTGMNELGKDFHVLLVSANSKDEIAQLRLQFEIPQEQMTHLQLQHDQIPEYLSACDIAFNPQCPVPSKRYGTPVKDGEYWAMGLPLLILPNISDDSDIVAKENAGLIIPDLSDESYQQVFRELKRRISQEPFDSNHIVHIAKKYRSKSIAVNAYQCIYRSNE